MYGALGDSGSSHRFDTRLRVGHPATSATAPPRCRVGIHATPTITGGSTRAGRAPAQGREPTCAIGPTVQRTDLTRISLGPAGGGCNKMNAAVPIGHLIGLALAVLALATWDYIRQRRRARMSGQEVAT